MRRFFPLAPTLSLIFLSFLSEALAAPKGQPRIENGIVVGRGDPLTRTVALLQFKNGGWCSSSFLSARTLLTAGHCAEKRAAGDLLVAVQNANGSWEQRALKRLTLHPGFSHVVNEAGEHIFKNDLAIAEIVSPFSFAVNTVKIAAPSAAMAKGNWEAVTDVGYGFSGPNSGGSVLRRGSMVGRVAKLKQLSGREGREQNRTSAAQNACPGDSGGAVLLGKINERQQIAVHSMADGCTAESTLTYSELLYPAREWIQSQIRP